MRTSPAPVQSARALLAVVAVSHLVVPVVLAANASALRDQIASRHPDFAAAEVAQSAAIAVVSGAVFHGVLLLLCALFLFLCPGTIAGCPSPFCVCGNTT